MCSSNNQKYFLFLFKGMNQRNGTDVDAGNAMKVFAKLGYKVKVYNDQTVEQMKQVLTAGKCDSEFIEITQKSLHTLMNTMAPNYWLLSLAVLH